MSVSAFLARRGFKVGPDLVLAFVVVAVISLMIFPVPPFALDILIATNLAISIGILILALYIPGPLGLSTFPSLLLFTTLFRLSLNIASTKQVLLHAHAGDIIDVFGKLVVGGNYVVGGVVFLIITIVQFIVIAKGSERVAEVAARFTLDAMPGKQMSIDADLRAGMLTKDEARIKRKTLEKESQMGGAMDGAMKFVKGDAIAGLIISFVNITAGAAIGSIFMGLTVSESFSKFAILTIGDGMVSQIPSLFITIAAGILITRVSVGDDDEVSNLGTDISAQLFSHPRALGITSVVVLMFAVVPGFPKIPFLILGGTLAWFTWQVMRRLKAARVRENFPAPAFGREGVRLAPKFALPEPARTSVPLQLQLGSQLYAAVQPMLLDRSVAHERAQLVEFLGLPFPGLSVALAPFLDANAFAIRVHEVQALHATWDEADANQVAAHARNQMSPTGGSQVGALVISGREAGQGVAVASQRSDSSLEATLARNVAEVMRQKAHEFLGLQEAHQLLSLVENTHPNLASEVQRAVPLMRVADVLRRLVEEQVSVRNMVKILEALMTWSPKEKDIVMLVEYVRMELGAKTVEAYVASNGELHFCMLDPQTEQELKAGLQQSVMGNYIALSSDKLKHMVEQINLCQRKVQQEGSAIPLVILCSMELRKYVRKLIEPTSGALPVLSYQEIRPNVKLKQMGRLSI
jgi:type III secretion protein V